MSTRNTDRLVFEEAVVEANVSDVWQAWTTREGVLSFFASACNIDVRVDGPYEMLFNLAAEPGSQGGEGVKILAIQPEKMLSFTWNAPPQLPDVRFQHTHVVVRFEPLSELQTRVTLRHDGWGEGGQWDQAFDYFSKAWGRAILPRLQYRFSVGPVDWDNPPKFD